VIFGFHAVAVYRENTVGFVNLLRGIQKNRFSFIVKFARIGCSCS